MSPEPWADARARLDAAGLGVAIRWPNEPFDLPEPITPTGAFASPWLEVEAQGDVLEPVEMGPGAWQERGTLYVHVLVPRDSGTAAARQLAKDVANVFRGAAGFTTYRRAAIGAGGPDEDGVWFVMTVSIDWEYTDRPA